MAEGDREMTDDPNEAYEVVPTGPGPHGPPKGWWTAKRNGLPVRHFPGKGNAQRYATDPEYRASLAAGKAHRHNQPDSRLHAGMRDRRAPGYGFLRTELPTILATRTDALSPRMLRVIEELAGDWRRLDQRIDGLSGEIEALARQDQACSRLMTVPGIGPIILSAMVAAIGTGDVFSKGRDFGAWLGLVPKQISTGDRTILGKISRRGNRYLRVLFVQAAWVVLVRIKNWERYGLKSWIEAAKRRLHHNVLAIALANKLARIAWAVLAKGRAFELTRTDDAGVRPA